MNQPLPPLTLDQITERDGLRVWVKNTLAEDAPIPYRDEYGVVYAKLHRVESLRTIWRFENYGKTWIAYGAKPFDANTSESVGVPTMRNAEDFPLSPDCDDTGHILKPNTVRGYKEIMAIHNIEKVHEQKSRLSNQTMQLAIEALNECIARRYPMPLTLEQLLDRQGKPVWLDYNNTAGGFTGWAIFYSMSAGNAFMQFNAGCNCLYTNEYGQTWIAFDSEPSTEFITGICGQGKPFLEALRDMNMVQSQGPADARFTSDYDPDTYIQFARNEDGDIILRLHGKGEMRLATSGGKLHGMDMITVQKAFGVIIDTINKDPERYFDPPEV